MLTFVLNDGFEIEWHIGTRVPEIWQAKDPTKPRRFVTQIVADCDEKDHITRTFQNIPTSSAHRMTVWSGEYAKFIYENLHLNDPIRIKESLRADL